MWFLPYIKSVSPDLLAEVWLCAHILVLNRRCFRVSGIDDADVRRELCAAVRGCLASFAKDEWGQEAVMACHQRGIENALSLDVSTLGRVCGVNP